MESILESMKESLKEKFRTTEHPFIIFNHLAAPIELLRCFTDVVPINYYMELQEDNNRKNVFPQDFCDMAKIMGSYQPRSGGDDLLVCAATCGVSLKSAQILSSSHKCLVVDLPRSNASSDVSYLQKQYLNLYRVLSDHFQRKVTARALAESIRTQNHLRRALRAVYAKRALPHPPLSATLAREFLFGQFGCGENYLDLLTKVGRSLGEPMAKEYGVMQDRARITLLGPAAGEMLHSLKREDFVTKFLALVESMGFAIVLESGIRLEELHCEDTSVERILGQLARHHLTYQLTNCGIHNPETVRRSVEEAQTYQVDGAIYCNLKFCEPNAFEVGKYEEAFRKARIPLLRLEVGADFSRTGQLLTRLETFRHMLGR